MRSERGQASIEWIGIVLLLALVVGALAHFAPRADGRRLATTLAHSVTQAAKRTDRPEGQVVGMRSGKRDAHPPPAREAFMVPPLIPRPGEARPAPGEGRPAPGRPAPGRPAPGRASPAPGLRLPDARGLLRQARRGLDVAWRRAWLACLAYERARWGFLHPESRFTGYPIPRSELLRMANDCISPVDLVRDWPLYRGR
jgi:hypothetical protein